MIAIARFEVQLAETAAFEKDIKAAYEALASCEGFIDGEFGQNLDDSNLWALVTRWENVGSYRRALSAVSYTHLTLPTICSV